MTEEIEPFALSQEELLAALGLVGLPALPGFDDLAARVFGTLDKKSRIAVLAAAERALIAHGYAYPDAEGSKLDGCEGSLHEKFRLYSGKIQDSWAGV